MFIIKVWQSPIYALYYFMEGIAESLNYMANPKEEI